MSSSYLSKDATKRDAEIEHLRQIGHELRCYWCGTEMMRLRGRLRGSTMGRNPNLATVEHLVPRSEGGGGGFNLVLACRLCNTRRGAESHWIPFSEHGKVGERWHRTQGRIFTNKERQSREATRD